MRPDEVNGAGFTALMLAVAAGNTNEAADLIRQGANLNAQNHRGETALLLALRQGDGAMAHILLAAGADPNLADFDCYAPLFTAVHPDGDAATVELLLAKGAAVNQKNCLGETALHRAAYLGCPELASRLIAAGAAVDEPDRHGNTPLHRTAAYGWEAVAARLLAAGADQMSKNRAGHTPLELALAGHWADLAAVLLAKPDAEELREELRRTDVSSFGTKDAIAIREAALEYRDFNRALTTAAAKGGN